MTLILGGPGTGKTTRLINIVAEKLEQGISPARIGFVSFTRKAAREAAERACARFGLQPSSLPYFRTLHSLAYAQAGVRQAEVMGRKDMLAFGELVGMNFSAYISMDGPMVAGGEGDKMMQILAYSRATCKTLEEAWHETGEGVEWFELQYFAESFANFKRDMYKIDFDDMLDRYEQNCNPVDLDVVIIDEAQDLSARQWQLARHAFKFVPEIYIAGDDDQAIYRWSGADIEHFLRLSKNPEVLPHSYRLPREVYDLANKVSGKIAHRYAKNWTCAEHRGDVIRTNAFDDFDYGNGSWMILARSHFFLNDFKEEVKASGHPFRTSSGSSLDADEVRAILIHERVRNGKDVSAEDVVHLNKYLGHNRFKPGALDETQRYAQKHIAQMGYAFEAPWYDALLTIGDADRQYYQAVLRNGHKLNEEPSIYIGTIHSVKGGEADNVVLMTDISYRTSRGLEMSPDDEHRVFYTGLTRAKQNLYILDPTTQESYDL